MCPVDRCGFGIVNNGIAELFGPVDPGDPNAGFVPTGQPGAGGHPVNDLPAQLPKVKINHVFKTRIGHILISAPTNSDFWAAYDEALKDWPYQTPDLACQAGFAGDVAVASECGTSKLDLLRLFGIKICHQQGIDCGDQAGSDFSGLGTVFGIAGKIDFGGGRDGNIGGPGGRDPEEAPGITGCNSFAGTTRVLMADGSSKPIDQIKVGDQISNAAPGAPPGTTDQKHTVTAVHVTYTDRIYTDVTVQTDHGPATIVGTAHHLY